MEWIRGPAIGRGATATVSLATTIPSGELFAVKSTELCHSKFLQKESYVLSKLSCPYVVKYIGCDVTNETNNKPMFNLCMEYVAGGTLSDEIQRVGGRLDEDKVKFYSHQILQGLNYIHVNGVAHCDIKSQNILIGEEGAKITDLGCAKLIGKVCSDERFDTTAFSGTPAFMAPEVARGEEQGFEADIWALGCTIIEMCTGNSPWPELNDPVSALYKIGFSRDVPEIPTWLSEKGKDFLSKCLKRNSEERWTAEELLQHPFLEKLDHPLKKAKASAMDSPCSALDQAFWDLIPQEIISMNSETDRIKKLLQGTQSPAPMASCWTWTEDWMTVRSSGIEENKEFSDDDDDGFSFTAPQFLGPSEELVIGSLVFDEDDFFIENCVENVSDFYSSFLAFDSVTDDFFVSDNLNFETINLIHSPFLHVNFSKFSFSGRDEQHV